MTSPGHNGGPPIDTEDGKLRWVKINIGELLEGIDELNWEQRGYYLTALFKMYARMGGIPDDPYEGARAMRCDVRFFKRLRAQMLAAGKFYVEDGLLKNKRVEREITEYVREFRRRRDAALEREEQKRQERAAAEAARKAAEDARDDAELHRTSDELPADFPRTSPGLRGDLSEKSAALPAEVPETYRASTPKKPTKTTSQQPQLWSGSGAYLNHKSGPNQNQEPEPREEREDSPQPPKGGDAVLEAFETWWAIYPPSTRKVAKGECMALFRQAVTGHRRAGKRGQQKILDHGLVTTHALIEAVQRYAATKPDPEFTPAPATWLNQGRWLDDAYKSAAVGAGAPWWTDPAKVAIVTVDQWRTTIRKHANGIWPVAKLGPPPGSKNCKVPAALIAEMCLLEIYDDNGLKRPNSPAAAWMTH